MNGIYCLLPYKCESHNEIVSQHDEDNKNLCVRCGTKLCMGCAGSHGSVCSPCIGWIRERLKTPKEYYKKVFLRKLKAKEMDNGSNNTEEKD